VLEIQRAVAGHLERKALFTAVAEALERVSPVDRVTLLLPSADPSALRVYAAHGKGGTKTRAWGARRPCRAGSSSIAAR
jgi:hypothetical protein